MLFTVTTTWVCMRLSLCVCMCVCRCSEWCDDTILSPASLCSGRDNYGSADAIPPSLPATFEFNHRGSAVVQITLGSSTPSHYQDRNWILEKPRGRAQPANLLLICLWLVWPESFYGMHFVVRRPCLTRERQGPRWERRRCMLNRDQELGALEDINSFLRAENDIAQFSPNTSFVFIIKAISAAALCSVLIHCRWLSLQHTDNTACTISWFISIHNLHISDLEPCFNQGF